MYFSSLHSFSTVLSHVVLGVLLYGCLRIAVLAMILTLLLLKSKLFCYVAFVNSFFFILIITKGALYAKKESLFEFPGI